MIKLLIEAGPLVLFFVVNARAGIMAGTAAFMAATLVSLAVAWRRERRLPIMPLVTCVFVMVFGGLTLWLKDDTFIKVKPTILYLLFAGTLGIGLVLKRNVLKPLMGSVLALDEAGWRRLALRWALFFLVLAVANEAVWRSVPTSRWIEFKLFIVLPLTLLFSLAQVPLILKHQVNTEAGEGEAGD